MLECTRQGRKGEERKEDVFNFPFIHMSYLQRARAVGTQCGVQFEGEEENKPENKLSSSLRRKRMFSFLGTGRTRVSASMNDKSDSLLSSCCVRRVVSGANSNRKVRHHQRSPRLLRRFLRIHVLLLLVRNEKSISCGAGATAACNMVQVPTASAFEPLMLLMLLMLLLLMVLVATLEWVVLLSAPPWSHHHQVDWRRLSKTQRLKQQRVTAVTRIGAT